MNPFLPGRWEFPASRLASLPAPTVTANKHATFSDKASRFRERKFPLHADYYRTTGPAATDVPKGPRMAIPCDSPTVHEEAVRRNGALPPASRKRAETARRCGRCALRTPRWIGPHRHAAE